MKKQIAFAALAAVLALGSFAQEPASPLSIHLTGSLLFPNDAGYRDTYGSVRFYPEVRLAYGFSGGYFAYASYGMLSASGTTPGLAVDASSTQHVLSLGGGIGGPLAGKLSYQASLGLFLDAYKEEALDARATGSGIGFRADAGCTYPVTDKLTAHASVGYLTASDTSDFDVKIRMGGFRLGLGLGYRF